MPICPAADRRFSYRGEDVVQTLERVCGRIGYSFANVSIHQPLQPIWIESLNHEYAVSILGVAFALIFSELFGTSE